jgi:tryptophan-rich sensory protein
MQDGRIGDDRSGGPVMTGLAANQVVFVGLPLVLNGVIFGLGWDRASGPQVGIPPGWIVGALWVVLFAGMGTARWLLLRAARRHEDQQRAEWVSLLAFLCLLYPLYTLGLRDDRVGLVGNLITAVVGIGVSVFAWRRVRAAGVWLAAVCAWLLYAAGATAYGIWR